MESENLMGDPINILEDNISRNITQIITMFIIQKSVIVGNCGEVKSDPP